MLQRGRGAGHLWALSAPREEALAAVMACVREDPRRDRQLDHVEDVYAEVFEALAFSPAPLEEILRGPGHDPAPETAERATDLAMGILVRVAARHSPRSEEALRILREYLATGTAWVAAFDTIVIQSGDSADVSWLGDAIAARFPDDAGLRAAMESNDTYSWDWSIDDGRIWHPRILAIAKVLKTERDAGWKRPLPSPDPASLPTERLLAMAPGLTSRFRTCAEELAGRTGPGDRDALRAAFRGAQEIDTRVLAIHALALQGEEEVFAPAMEFLLSAAVPRYLRRFLIRAIKGLPPPLTLPWARQWYGGNDVPRHNLATWILEDHALPEDRARIESVIARSLDECPWEEPPACVCGDIHALERAGAADSRALLERVFREAGETLARENAMEMLVGTPGGLPEDFAHEGLWDGCRAVRKIAAKWAPLDAPGVRERLRVLAARDPEDEWAATVAAERLAVDA